MSKLGWDEYTRGEVGGTFGFCKKDISLGQFSSVDEYRKFAEESLLLIINNRADMKSVEHEE
jgi:hypothetical protein